MNVRAAGAPPSDITVRDLLSSLTALQALSMVMNDSRTEDEILDLAVSALPSLSHHCRAEAVLLDGEWRAVPARAGVGVGAGLEALTAGLSSAGGAVKSPGVGWAWAFPLSSRGGASGYLVVGSAEPPPDDEWTLIQALAHQTGAALANTRLLARERATRARIADEQATLRRVAALVTEAATPEDVFAAVAAEAGRLRDADIARMSRYDRDGAATAVGSWASSGDDHPLPLDAMLDRGGRNVHALVFETGQPARIEGYGDDVGPAAAIARQWAIRSVVGVPIHIEGRLWGVIDVGTRREEPLPADTEAWLAGFTELVAAAIANAEARVELRGIAEEQAALRRVATLVAAAASPDEVFAAVAAEVGSLLEVDAAAVRRYDADGSSTILASWTMDGISFPLPVGSRTRGGGRSVVALVFDTGRPARIDDFAHDTGPAADLARTWGARWSLGVPISVEGRLWGVISVASTREEPPPSGTEERLAAFTELLGTALANAEARASLTASRVRIVAAGDTARHRIERDLHDGAQQRLVSLALQLRAMHAAAPPGAGDLAAQVAGLAQGLDEALEELRELARGIHPAALAEGGLAPALKTLTRRSAVPVRLDVSVDRRLPEQIELAAYCVVAEGVTNAAKHAHASVIDVHVSVSADALRASVRDDGGGGADATRGSGLVGLADRVEALGGSITVHSPPGAGTSLALVLPLG